MEIRNIITEPSNTGMHFLAYGLNTFGESTLVFIDLSTLHKEECTNADTPGALLSDYEYFTNGKCILGKTFTYIKRKQKSNCFNPKNFE